MRSEGSSAAPLVQHPIPHLPGAPHHPPRRVRQAERSAAPSHPEGLLPRCLGLGFLPPFSRLILSG